jgi:hypothetical protein
MLARMRTKAAEWAERVRAWRESGLSADEFSKPRGYRSKTLAWWASELARRSRKNARPKVAMARVLRVVRPEAERDEAIAVLVGGAQIAVRPGFNARLLRDVVVALGAPR